jgi:amino acid adenylation domain-containing protein
VFTLHGAMLRAAEAEPDSCAVVATDGTLTYGELAVRSAQVAAVLVDLGVQPGDRVALWSTKSTAALAALYGILGSGAAYVPIDPQSPPARGTRIVADAGCRVVCTDSTSVQQALSPLDGETQTVGLTEELAGATVPWSDVERVIATKLRTGSEADLAYLLYTSGSTGAPKGVMLTHRNALAFAEWAVDRFQVTRQDRLANHAPFHFDLSVFDLYGAALAGAMVRLLAPGETAFGTGMAGAIRDSGITIWYSTPSALILLLDGASADDMRSLRVVLFAGEVFPIKHLRSLRALVPHALLANLYGPTETNVCTYHVVDDDLVDDRPLPIGVACENQEAFALDEDLTRTPEGGTGQLWVRGPTVMKGYWGDPERTARSLRQNPLHDRFPDPTYDTGDLVRRLPGDVFEFLGRRDHQVKSRGYRIELGEIETALTSHPAVREAAVVPVPDERIGNALVAVLAATEAVDPMEVKRHCATHLPRYMIPGAIVRLDELPHTSTGKIDRQALAALVSRTVNV